MSDEDTGAERLLGLVHAVIDAASWRGARLVVERHPDLLNVGIVDALDLLGETCRDEGLLEHARAYEQCAEVLRLCLEVGIASAFDEMAGLRKFYLPADVHDQPTESLNADPALVAYLEADGQDAIVVLEQHPDVISQASVDRIQELIKVFRERSDEYSVSVLVERMQFIQRLL